MRLASYFLAALALIGLAAPPALAQAIPGTITYTDLPGVCNTARTQCVRSQPIVGPDGQPLSGGVNCTTVTGTLSATGQTLSITCSNAGAFSITATPTGFAGSISVTSATGAPKRVIRNGQAPLQISTVPFVATDSGPRYYAVNGGNGIVITAVGVTAGSITLSISATGSAIYPIPIGEYQTSALVALLNGRGFTGGFPGGTLNVPNNNLACLTITNPAGSGVRGIYESRQMSTDVISTQQPPRFFVVNNAAAGMPTTAATINNRGAGGTSALQLTYGSLTALPTGGATALGGYVPTNGQTYSPPLEKTIEPGTNQTMCVIGVNATGGVGVTSSPSIIFGWREQNIN